MDFDHDLLSSSIKSIIKYSYESKIDRAKIEFLKPFSVKLEDIPGV